MSSTAIFDLLKRGPFPNQIDPWAEAGRYFHPIHTDFISQLMSQAQAPLFQLGYKIGRETSLQITHPREPDLNIQLIGAMPTRTASPLPYATVAEAVAADPGTLLENTELELDALHIKAIPSGKLVTVIEIISPSNKTHLGKIDQYLEKRESLRQEQVHVMEIDLTRSVKRLVSDSLLESYPYHIAIHLWDEPARFIGLPFGEPLKRCAIPLQGQAIAIELAVAYEYAYQLNSTAMHLWDDTAYQESELPFPSLLTTSQRTALLQEVQRWRDDLATLEKVVS